LFFIGVSTFYAWFTFRTIDAASLTLGETSILTTNDGGNGDLLVSQQATLTQTAILQTMSFYVTTAVGTMRMAVYDATGPGGGPGTKLAETAQITPITGWNTTPVTTQVSLPAGSYWLAYLMSSSSMAFRDTGSGTAKWAPLTYGPMPATFPTSTSTGAYHWSFYATLDTVPDVAPPTSPTNVTATPLRYTR
jgi:hypothetical protein